jgi:hypothetical protein
LYPYKHEDKQEEMMTKKRLKARRMKVLRLKVQRPKIERTCSCWKVLKLQ